MFAMVIYVGQMSGGANVGSGTAENPRYIQRPYSGQQPSVGRSADRFRRPTYVNCLPGGRTDRPTRAAPLLTRPRPRSRGRRIPFPAGSLHIGLQSRRVDVIYENR